MDLGATILAAAGAIGISSAFMLGAGRWIADRVAKLVDAKVEARQAHALEVLRNDNQLELQKLQALETRVESRLGVATSFEHAAHVALLPKRIEAAERIWKSAMAISARMPRGLFSLDVVTEEEYPDARTRLDAQFPKPTDMQQAMDHVSLLLGTEPVEDLRPYASDELWNVFSAHRAFLGRVLFITISPHSKQRPWYRDEPTLDLLRAAVPAGLPLVGIGSWYSARTALEGALLEATKRLLDGAGASARSVEAMGEIERAIRNASAASSPKSP